MIITIDGPAGTGKSTAARAVAERLGFDFLDTGAMYRAVGFAAIRRQVDMNDARELGYVAGLCKIEFDWTVYPPGVILNGERVDHRLRGAEPTSAASHVAKVPAVRELMVEQQRRIGLSRPNLVTEGRDQGSVVFPDAELKFYLDAAPEVRADRRTKELRARGESPDYHQILDQIKERDYRDSHREVGPLMVPKGAEIVDTNGLTIEDVVARIIARAKALMETKS